MRVILTFKIVYYTHLNMLKNIPRRPPQAENGPLGQTCRSGKKRK